MAAVGKPEDNGYAERLMRTIKEEEVDLSEYADFHDAYQRIGAFWRMCTPASASTQRWIISRLPNLRRTGVNNTSGRWSV